MLIGNFKSFDIANWNINHINNLNAKYNTKLNHSKYITDNSLNGDKYMNNEKIDVLFLDSLHTYDLVKNETLLFEKYLNKKNIIIFHDTIWCMDAVLCWCIYFIFNKKIKIVKCNDTHKPQCSYCDRFRDLSKYPHGRPVIVNDRPEFQSDGEVNTSPYYNKLKYSDLKYETNLTFEECIKNNISCFTNIDAACGVGILVNF